MPRKLHSVDEEEEADFRLRRRRRVHAARRRWRLRFAVKCVVWLIGAYTVRLWDKESVKIYLGVSVLLYVFASILREGRHGHDADQDTGASSSLAPQQEAAATRGGPRPQEASRRDHQNHTHPAKREVAATAAAAQPPPPRTVAQTRRTAATASSLSPQQQLQLLTAMRTIGTPAAMRCITDASFRESVLTNELSRSDPCLCGGGQTYGRCCLPIRAELEAVCGESTRSS